YICSGVSDVLAAPKKAWESACFVISNDAKLTTQNRQKDQMAPDNTCIIWCHFSHQKWFNLIHK
ncbi:hypothetical protein, partial [Collinsella tanakaei]|uniref:hypothetical protein n=1 Tax=Collinsella tanakaei TaxID=626935 RepID=UPI00265B3C8C